MDKWKELELNKMKSGGNNKAKEFLEGQSDWKAGGSISANYNSKAAALYRDKVVTLHCLKVYLNIIFYPCRYQVRQKANPGVKRHLLQGITSLLILARLPPHDPLQNKCQRRGEWKKVKRFMASLTVQSQLEVIRLDVCVWSRQNLYWWLLQGGAEPTGAFHQTREFKAAKEDFFDRKQAENAMRRDDLPPSQGGKYAGFGSSCNSGPPARSFSTQDFASSTLGGLTNSLSRYLLIFWGWALMLPH